MEKYQLTPAEIEGLESKGFDREEIESAKVKVYRFEDWLAQRFTERDFKTGKVDAFYFNEDNKCTKKGEGELVLYLYPPNELEKIQQYKAEKLNGFETAYFEALVESFEIKEKGSFEPILLAESELGKVKDLIEDKFPKCTTGWIYSNLTLEKIPSIWLQYRNDCGDKSNLSYWFKKVCVNGENGVRYVRHSHTTLTANELNSLHPDDLHFVVSALAFHRFKKYLNAKLLENEPPALAAKILTESDCFIYEGGQIIGLSTGKHPDLSTLNALDETIAARRQAGKIMVKVNDRNAEGVIKGALKIGLTQSDLNVFIEKFAGGEYRKWHSGTHFDLLKNHLNSTSLLDEIFGIASSFDNPALGDYFLKSAFDEVQSVGNDTYFASKILVLNKLFKERLAERNAVAPTTVKAKAVRQPRTFQSLFKGIPEMERLLAAAASVGLIVKDGDGYAWIDEGAKSHRVCALWFAAVDAGLTNAPKNNEVTTGVIKGFFGIGLSKDTIGKVNPHNEEYKAKKAALEKKLKNQ